MPSVTTIETTKVGRAVGEVDADGMPKLLKDVNAFLKKKKVAVVVTKVEVVAGGKAVKMTCNADDPTPVKNAFK